MFPRVRPILWLGVLAAVCLMPSPVRADNSAFDLTAATEQLCSDAGDYLRQFAGQQGLKASAGTASVTTEGESSAALLPIAGTENLAREDIESWTPVAVFTASESFDPENDGTPEVAPGTYTVEVMAAAGMSMGEYRIVDANGDVVQQGDMEIDRDPNETPSMLDSLQITPSGEKATEQKAIVHLHHHNCPWYYPYRFPYYFRYFPSYKHGCHVWHYRWWWGRLNFRFCWFPSRFCHHCFW